MSKNMKKKRNIIIMILAILFFAILILFNYDFKSVVNIKGKSVTTYLDFTQEEAYASAIREGREAGEAAYYGKVNCSCSLPDWFPGAGDCGKEHYDPQVEWGPGNIKYRDKYEDIYISAFEDGYLEGWSKAEAKIEQDQYEKDYNDGYEIRI